MGTTYSVKYDGTRPEEVQGEVDSLLEEINQSLSTYIETSLISRVNRGEKVEVDSHFIRVFRGAKEIYKMSGGAFDPTLGPLINYWGFGADEERSEADPQHIDSLMQLIGFDKVHLMGGTITKDNKHMALSFAAIAKGYAVDQVAALLESKGVKNYLVEIGGELKCKGINDKKRPWSVAIDKPQEGVRERFAIVELGTDAIATSGNYRNIRIVNGRKMVHTIDPRTGFSSINRLLSASIVTKSCMMADGWATALMVLGKDQSVELLDRPGFGDLSYYLIYLDENDQLNVAQSKAMKEKARVSP